MVQEEKADLPLWRETGVIIREALAPRPPIRQAVANPPNPSLREAQEMQGAFPTHLRSARREDYARQVNAGVLPTIFLTPIWPGGGLFDLSLFVHL